MKRICVLILILIFSCITCYATETPTISVIQTENAMSNEISVNINISKESGACGGKIDVSYDNELLSPKEYKVSEELSNSMCFVNLEYGADVIRISWAGTEEITTDKICSLTFEVISDKGFSTELEIKQAKIADLNSETISVSTKNCEVSYENKSTVTTPTTPITPSHSGRIPSSTSIDSVPTEEGVDDVLQKDFVDVKPDDWFYENVKYVIENKLMNGISEEEFAPNNTLTRAMLVTVLYRNAGEPDVNSSAPFADVDLSSWYASAVIWAKKNGIVNGITENNFAPDANITREQIATIMHRYAQYKEYDVSVGENTNILLYSDAECIADYAIDSMRYLVGSGLIKGKSATTLNPKDNATRAEIAAILQRFIEANK